MDDAPPTWKALFNFTTKQHLVVLSVAIASAFASGGTVPVQSYLLGKVFALFANYGTGTISTGQLKDRVSHYNIWLTLLGAGSWLANAVFFASWSIFGELQARGARDRIFASLIGREIAWFDLRKDGAASLAVRLQSHIQYLQMATSLPLGMAFQNISTSLSSVGLSFYLSWRLTLVILAGLPVFAVVISWLSSRMQPCIAAQSSKLDEAAKHASAAFTGIETVKCLNGQRAEFRRYSTALMESARLYFRQVDLNGVQLALTRFATLSMFVQGFWFGSHLLDVGENTAGELLTAIWAAIMATGALMQIMPQLIVLDRGRSAGHSLRAVMMHEPSVVDAGPSKLRPKRCPGDIQLGRVSFTYPSRPNQIALTDVSIFFPAGELAFVIGQSGSGKSTIGQLLVGFYHSSKGTIALDGHEIRSLDPQWLRQNVLLVEQHSVLFRGSVLSNLEQGYIRGKLSRRDAIQAAEFASVCNVIQAMPDGFDTEVGSKGASLSGGQRQRIALARAWLRNPAVLILDESTSALDHKNRLRVMEAIRNWRKGRTTIVITHDISQILPNDFVSVMEEGKLVEEGFRSQLESRPTSVFRQRLIKPQQQAVVDEVSSSSSDAEQNVLAGSPGGSETIFDLHRPDEETEQPENVQGHEPDTALVDRAAEESQIDDPLEQYLSDRGFEHRSTMYLPTAYTNRFGVSSMRDITASPAIVSGFWSLRPVYTGEDPSTQSSQSSPRIGLQGTLEAIAEASPLGSTFYKGGNRLSSYAMQALPRIRSSHTPGSFPSSILTEGDEDTIPLTAALSSEEHTHFMEGPAAEADHPSLELILGTVCPNLSCNQRLRLILALVMTSAYAIATPLFSFVFSKLLATFYDPTDRKHKSLVYSLGVLGIAAGDALAIFVSQCQLQRCGQIWVNKLRLEAFKRILEQPREFFDYEENSPTKLSECLDHHAEEMQAILGRFVGYAFIAATMVLVSLLWSFSKSWKLTLVLLACAPVIYAISAGLQLVSAAFDKKSLAFKEDATEIFGEVFTNIKTVKALTLEKHFTEKHQMATAHVTAAGVRKALWCSIPYGLSQASMILLTVLAFHYGAKLITDGEYSLNDVFQVFSLLLFSVANAAMVLAYIPSLSAAKEAAGRLLRLADLPKTCHEHRGNVHPQSVGEIMLHNLNFRYPTRREQLVLRKVSFRIPAARTIAIVGTSGSGKSTIASLLLKLYSTGPLRPHHWPKITMSGRDIRRIHTKTLRELVALVPQTPVLFPGTVAENIAYGLGEDDRRSSAAHVHAAATLAGAADFIQSLTSGYATLIGEGGTGLSGGQMQRLAIARALNREPQVLILDEATSALDVENAALIRNTVRRLAAEGVAPRMTVIIITHSRDMMTFADHVVLLHQGRLIEQGGYQELLQRNGNFVRLLRGEPFDLASDRMMNAREGQRADTGYTLADEQTKGTARESMRVNTQKTYVTSSSLYSDDVQQDTFIGQRR